MAFNPGGVFSLYAGNPVVSGTSIASNWANNTLSDIANNGLSLCFLRDGSVPMSGSLLATSGTVGAPGLSFNADPTTGMYLPTPGTLAFTAGGVKVATLTSAGMSFNNVTGTTTTFNSTAANGILTTYQNSGTAIGYVGAGPGAFPGYATVGDFGVSSVGNLLLGYSGVAVPTMVMSTTGNVVINTPTSGVALTVNGVGGTTLGLQVNAGVSSAVANFNSTNSVGGYISFSNSGSLIGYVGEAEALGFPSAALGDFGITTNGSHTIYLGANSVTAMEITGAGNVIIPAPTSGIALTVNQPGNGSFCAEFITANVTGNSSGLYVRAGTNSSDNAFYVINAAGTVDLFSVSGAGAIIMSGYGAGTLTTDGSGRVSVVSNTDISLNSLGVGTGASGVAGEIRATGNITAYYSDMRLKDVKGPITNALEKVKSLDGFYFTANIVAQHLGYDGKKVDVGVSAQQVQAILPEIIERAPIDDHYMTLNYAKLVPLLIESIKELSAEVNALKKRVN